MKTLLSQFCEEFEGVVRPLLTPLGEASDTLGGVSGDLPVCEVLPNLREISHHLSTLSDKVAEQQAYVLIFGPLKSGKSTLMNGIAAAYVSEVTALPAYPCMVYVNHATERSFTVTRYSGKKESFSDVEAMRALMDWAHAELANTIREVENRGEVFDPALHSPQAIRRVDVHVPAPHLLESSAVLVDTPGLYTRMKFGYDRMTRDFRDAAACAIFVVKTDNLFLEQVFEEFNELLALFSRIFLLVNLDSTKRDLHPNGDLLPSLEGEHPERIITAFENLAMSAPLKQASEEGRLSIYPVDLLQAAAGRLRPDESGLSSSEPGGGEGEESGQLRATESFDRFLGDLTDYLNSTDYLVAFLGDSLRQARGLFDDLRRVSDMPAVAGLGGQVDELRVQRETCSAIKAACERLSAFAWKTSFQQLEADLKSITNGRIANRRDQSADEVAAAVDSWFEGDASFRSLIDDYVAPVLQEVHQDLALTARGVLETVATNATAGAELPPAITQDMATVELELAAMGKASVSAASEAVGLGAAPVHVTTSDIPVRKSLLDWLVFRSRNSVRRRLFGPSDEADREVPRHVKARRIGEQGREQLRQALLSDLERFFDDALDLVAGHMLGVYTRSLETEIDKRLQSRAGQNTREAAVVDKRLTQLSQVRARMDTLFGTLGTRETLLGELASRYGDTDPQQLTAPVDMSLDSADGAGGYSKAVDAVIHEEGAEGDDVAVRRQQALDEKGAAEADAQGVQETETN